jgi:hypothetical protein
MNDKERYKRIEDFVEDANDKIPFVEFDIVSKTRLDGDLTVGFEVEDQQAVVSYISPKDIYALAILGEDGRPQMTQLHSELEALMKIMLLNIVAVKEVIGGDSGKEIDDKTLDFFEFIGSHEMYWDELVKHDFVVGNTTFEWNVERSEYPQITYLIKHFERIEEFEKCDTLKKINKFIEPEESEAPDDIKYDFRNTWTASYDDEKESWKISGIEEGRTTPTEIFFEDLKLLKEYVEEYNVKIEYKNGKEEHQGDNS